MRPAGAGRSTGFLQLLCDGGTLQLAAGGLGLLCLVFDYGWTEPAVPNAWDPPVPGVALRGIIAAVAVLYVFVSVPAAVVFWRFVSVGTFIRAIQLCLGCLLVLLVYRSNAASDAYYTGANWTGAFWLTAQRMLVISVLLAGIGYVSSFPFEEHACLAFLLRLLPQRRRRPPLGSMTEENHGEQAANQALQTPLLADPAAEEEDDERAEVTSMPREHNNARASVIPGDVEQHAEVFHRTVSEEHQQEREEDEADNEHGDTDSDEFHNVGSSDVEWDIRAPQERRRRGFSRDSIANAAASFCRASHAPFVFGCSAYILALAVCSFSLILSFYSFEPNSQCISALGDPYAPRRKLVLESSVRSSFPLGDALQLEFRSESPDLESTTVVIHDRLSPGNTVWQSVRGESFIAAGTASMVSWSIVNIFYFSDTVHSLSGKQTIREARLLSGNRVQIVGDLHTPSHVLPYEVTFAAREDASGKEQDVYPQSASFTMHVNITFTNDVLHDGSRVYIVYARDAEEQLLGFGTQLSYSNFAQGCIPVIASNKGYGRGLQPFTFFMNRFNEDTGGSWQHVHTAIPSYVTSRGRAAAMHHDFMTVFDLIETDRIGMEVITPRIKNLAMFDASFSAILQPGAENWTRSILAAHQRNMLQGLSQDEQRDGEMQRLDTLSDHSSMYEDEKRREFAASSSLPAWAGQGIIVTAGGGVHAVETTLKRYSSANVSVAAVILRDWAGVVSTGFGYSPSLDWTPDNARYPNIDDFVDRLRESYPGLRVLAYFSPYVAATMQHAHPVSASASPNSTYADALANGCLVVDEDVGNPVVKAVDVEGSLRYGIINLLDADCQAWYEDVLVHAGRWSDGWVADHGDGYPVAKKTNTFAVATGNTEAHIRYAGKWLETSAAAGRRVAGDDALVISRTATLRSLPYVQLHTTGEQLMTWDAHDGLASALTGILNSGIAGMPATASYIGGVYRTWDSFGLMRFTRSTDLMIRWLELAVFASPTLLTHSGMGLSQRPLPAALQLDALCGRKDVQGLLRMHEDLWPLKRRLLADARRTGVPMMRGVWVEFPNDPATFRLRHQFMLGADLLVCPVLSEGAGGAHCYVPESAASGGARWKEFRVDGDAGRVLDPGVHGTAFWCEAPLGQPCVLQRVRASP